MGLFNLNKCCIIVLGGLKMVKIVTDSSCDLPENVINELDIRMVSMNVDVDGVEYKERINLEPHEFWEKMRHAVNLPKTSQPSPLEFEEEFLKIEKEGNTPLCITISSNLSGTYQSALMASKMMKEEITIFDSLAGSLSHGVQVLKAARMARDGANKEEILEELTKYRKTVKIIIPLFTVENIVKGGRLNKLQGGVVKLLNIKVIAEGIDGAVEVRKKVRGRKRFIEEISNIIQTLKPESYKILGITHVDNMEDAQRFKSEMEQLYDNEIIINDMGPVMATYAGEKGLILAL
ncbi:MAG: fatty acid kinase fatty acid binding subunit [Thermotogaceae bacterium]|nr:fatty acid kinase fatty acid binding subunit [Thermotogaceae bacterium]